MSHPAAVGDRTPLPTSMRGCRLADIVVGAPHDRKDTQQRAELAAEQRRQARVTAAAGLLAKHLESWLPAPPRCYCTTVKRVIADD